MSIIYYRDVVLLNRLATAVYWFSDDALVMGRYVISGDIIYLDYEVDELFKEYHEALVQKYGSAQSEEGGSVWLTDRSLIQLWKVKQKFGTLVLLDYYEKDFYMTHLSDRGAL